MQTKLVQSLNSSRYWNATVMGESLKYLNKRHTNYIITDYYLSCYLSSEFQSDIDATCRYVTSTSSCTDKVEFINYLKFLVCTLRIVTNVTGLVKIIIFALAVFGIFIILMCIMAIYFIIPNFITLSRVTRMRGFDFGIIVMPLYLHAPKILYELFKCHNVLKSETILLTAVLGSMSGFFPIGMLILCCNRNYKIEAVFIVRDLIISVIGAVYVVEIINYKAKQEYFKDNLADLSDPFQGSLHATISILIYFLYVCVVVAQGYEEREKSRIFKLSVAHQNNKPVNINASEWDVIKNALNPYEHLTVLPNKAIIIICPIWFILSLLIPVFDINRPRYGWSKYLTIIHLSLIPIIPITLQFNIYVTFVISGLAVIFVTLTAIFTSANELPHYFAIFTSLSLVVGVTIFSMICIEVEAITWQILNYVYNWESDAIAIFVFQFPYVIAEIIFCYSLLKQKHTHMVYGFVFGWNIVNIYSALPMLAFQTCVQSENLQGLVSANSTTAYVYIILMHAFTLIGISFTNFELRVSFGIYIIIIYCTYVLYVILSAGSIVHPFGTQHSQKLFLETSHADWA